MRRMTAADLMTPDIETIDASEPVAEAAARLGSSHLGRLVVVDTGTAVGVISVSDVVAAFVRGPAERRRRTVGDAMSRGFVACPADTPAWPLARTMTDHRSRSVFVLSPDGQALGVVTGQDLIRLEEGSEERPALELMHHPISTGLRGEPARGRWPHPPRRGAPAARRRPNDPSALPLGVLSTADVLAEMVALGSPWLQGQ